MAVVFAEGRGPWLIDHADGFDGFDGS